MHNFKSKLDAYKWLAAANAGTTYVCVNGHIRGYDPSDRRLYVVVEVDPTPMW